jgi:hypothetical protein
MKISPISAKNLIQNIVKEKKKRYKINEKDFIDRLGKFMHSICFTFCRRT